MPFKDEMKRIAWQAEYNRTHRKEQQAYKKSPNGRYLIYKNYHAKKRGLVFELTVNQFDELTKQPCFYCGGYCNSNYHTGLDRVDNSRGYVLDNLVPCCQMCNRAKHTRTQTEFKEWVIKLCAVFLNS